jgi:hypothetical protein
MSSPSSGRAGDGDWVSLLDGVRVSRRWMTEHTPSLLAAWRRAETESRRRAVAAQILQAAADLESEPTTPGAGVEECATGAWRVIAEQLDRGLTHGQDWPPLALALTRAKAAGYDVAARLPALAGASPLPERHAARELHWRLLVDCPAAAPALSSLRIAGESRPTPTGGTPADLSTDPARNPLAGPGGGTVDESRPHAEGAPQP